MSEANEGGSKNGFLLIGCNLLNSIFPLVMKPTVSVTKLLIAMTLIGHLAFAALWAFWQFSIHKEDDAEFEVVSLTWK